MGFVRVKFRIINPMEKERYIDVEGVVDTGAIYTVVPKTLLESIGLKPVEKRRFRAFGGDVEREVGVAEVELMGRKGGYNADLWRERGCSNPRDNSAGSTRA